MGYTDYDGKKSDSVVKRSFKFLSSTQGSSVLKTAATLFVLLCVMYPFLWAKPSTSGKVIVVEVAKSRVPSLVSEASVEGDDEGLEVSSRDMKSREMVQVEENQVELSVPATVAVKAELEQTTESTESSSEVQAEVNEQPIVDEQIAADSKETAALPEALPEAVPETLPEEVQSVDSSNAELKEGSVAVDSGAEGNKEDSLKSTADASLESSAVDDAQTAVPDVQVTGTLDSQTVDAEAQASVEVESPPLEPSKDDAAQKVAVRTVPARARCAPKDVKCDLMERVTNLTETLAAIRPFVIEKDNTQLLKHMDLWLDRSAEFRKQFKDGTWPGDEKVVGIVKLLETINARAKEWKSSFLQIEKLRTEVDKLKSKVLEITRERNQLDLAAAKALPKSLHCLNLRLTVEFGSIKSIRLDFSKMLRKNRAKFTDKSFFHYALFSDNVIAAAVVVKSLEDNAKDPSRHVVHMVTDKMNLAAMQAWFALHPPKKMALEIKAIEEFKFLTPEYCPVLQQLQAKNLKQYYFSQGSAAPAAGAPPGEKPADIGGHAQVKFKNPKYLSMMNHLRFYLPEMYNDLERVVFLDDDIVVQKDLSELFTIPLNGNVNGAVFTCKGDFHRLNKYLNFSHPFVKKNFDSQGCGWAYGMNVFDLKEWRKSKLTEVYHKYQSMNTERTLWQLGTLPPGLMTFYGRTEGLDSHWHVLGLGYRDDIGEKEVNEAAVVHWNGNWKPWLDTALKSYKGLWAKYLDPEDEIVQQCNIDLL